MTARLQHPGGLPAISGAQRIPVDLSRMEQMDMVPNAIWLFLGLLATAAGIAGVVLPLVPTTPFLLLAAYSFARSSPTAHNWLVRHPTLGRPLDDWQKHRAIDRRTKAVSIATMIAAYAGSVVAGFPPWVLALQALALVLAGAFIVSRAGRRVDEI